MTKQHWLTDDAIKCKLEIFSWAIFLCFEHRGVILMQCFMPLTSCMFSISHVFTYLNGRLSILEHLNCHSVVLMVICHIYMKWCLLLLKVSSEEQTIDDLIKKKLNDIRKTEMQLNFNISETDIMNTVDVSKWIVSPNHLFFKVFYPQYLEYSDILKFLQYHLVWDNKILLYYHIFLHWQMMKITSC